jgi:predicted phosphoadenosine phosphosulfate sulfurtransferase
MRSLANFWFNLVRLKEIVGWVDVKKSNTPTGCLVGERLNPSYSFFTAITKSSDRKIYQEKWYRD